MAPTVRPYARRAPDYSKHTNYSYGGPNSGRQRWMAEAPSTPKKKKKSKKGPGDYFYPSPHGVPTGDPGFDQWAQSYVDAGNRANLTNLSRYWDIRGGDSEKDAAMGGYLQRYNQAMGAFAGREEDIGRRYAAMEGRLKDDAVSRGLITTKTYGDLGGLARQQEASLTDLEREKSVLRAGLHKDLLDFMERRQDEPPDMRAALAAAQMAGRGGVGYGGGQRYRLAKVGGRSGRNPQDYAKYYYQGKERGWRNMWGHKLGGRSGFGNVGSPIWQDHQRQMNWRATPAEARESRSAGDIYQRKTPRYSTMPRGMAFGGAMFGQPGTYAGNLAAAGGGGRPAQQQMHPAVRAFFNRTGRFPTQGEMDAWRRKLAQQQQPQPQRQPQRQPQAEWFDRPGWSPWLADRLGVGGGSSRPYAPGYNANPGRAFTPLPQWRAERKALGGQIPAEWGAYEYPLTQRVEGSFVDTM